MAAEIEIEGLQLFEGIPAGLKFPVNQMLFQIARLVLVKVAELKLGLSFINWGY